jgi:hypothetical protein
MLQTGRSPVRIPDKVELLNLPNPSSRTMALGSTQPLRKMSIRNLPGGKKWPARLTSLPPPMRRLSENVEAATSRNPMGLHGLYRDNFTFTFTSVVRTCGAGVVAKWERYEMRLILSRYPKVTCGDTRTYVEICNLLYFFWGMKITCRARQMLLQNSA